MPLIEHLYLNENKKYFGGYVCKAIIQCKGESPRFPGKGVAVVSNMKYYRATGTMRKNTIL